ncbi:MAG: peptidase [Caulobacteraceae bacterium]|nr:peptidase [Caulobacteraceae bacterium]
MIGRALRAAAAALSVLFAATPCLAATATSPFANWAAVVAAGDYRDHDGAPSEIFDNARRDVSSGLIADGFSKANLTQFSIFPDRYPEPKPSQTDQTLIGARLVDEAKTATSGCLYYYTSHGAQDAGAIWAATPITVIDPGLLNQVLDIACGSRPTVVVVSACFSGFYVPFLAAPNRMIMTAARADRTSFGCGATDKYPYFDDCFISSLKTAHDFVALGSAVQACVATKEKALQAAGDSNILPSEPQISIGADIAKTLPGLAFRR